MEKEYDLIVLGGGPAGYVGAIRAAQLGARVALVEEERLGGTCLNWGCIPTKALVESARLYENRKHLAQFGLLAGEIGFDLTVAVGRKENIVTDLVKGLQGLLSSYGITIIKGSGRPVAPDRVAVDGAGAITAPRLLLATGSTAAIPPIPGVDGKGVITSKEALAQQAIPARLAIIGGGVIGVEMAGIFAPLGTEVTLLEALPRILPMADEEATKVMARSLAALGVKIQTGVKVERIEGAIGAKRIHLGDQVVEADLVLIATGRKARLEALQSLGLNLTRTGVVTDPQMMTNLPGVGAAGDIVAESPMLAHVAFHEAKVAVENLLGHPARMDYRAVPQAVFGPIDLAQVGLTEAEATAAGHTVKIGRFPMAASGRAMTLGETQGFVKVVAEERYGAVLGIHMVGAHASELLGEATLAVQTELTVAELADTMHMHPTLTEGIAEATLAAYTGALHLPRPRPRGAR